jgi:hypothetical protein
MFKCQFRKYKLRLYLNGLLCSLLIGCSSPSGSYDLGKADAQLGGLIDDHPAIRKELEEIRVNVQKAESALKEKEKIIEALSQTVAKEQQKADSRLLWIWKLTSVLVGILLVVGLFLAWKLR